MSRVNELVGLIRESLQEGVGLERSKGSVTGAFPLPHDYVNTIEKLGSGFSIDEKLSVLHPGVVCRDFRQHQCDLERIHKSEGVYFLDGRLASLEKSSPGTDYVRFSNLVCWGLDDSGKKIFWDSAGEPDRWQVVATDCSVSWVRHKMSFSDYLYGIISRNLSCPVFTKPAWPHGKVRHLVLHEIDC